MNSNTNSKQFSAEDIQKYLTGSLSPLQMNAMEKAALEDAFLAEAMEGYAGADDKNWQNQLDGLKQQFAQQSQAKVVTLRRPNRNWMKAAAAVLLIGGAATLSYFLVIKKETVEIALQVTPANIAVDSLNTIAAAPTTTEEIISVEKNAESEAKSNTNNTLATTEQLAKIEIDEAKIDSNFVYTPAKTAAAKPGSISTDAAQRQTEEVTAAKSGNQQAAPVTLNNTASQERSVNANMSAAADKAETEQTSRKREQKQFSRNFMAQVVAPDNSPLPFANVNIKSDDFGTYADARGNFRLVSTDSVLLVEVKAAGYKPQYYTLQSNTLQNRIVLAEDNNAFKDFTVITGAPAAKAKASRRATLLKDSVVNVEPADGWDNYNTYADNNIEIPDDILQKNIHGRVELSFDVKPNGAIANIKVDKSLCNNCDEAAIRLLQQGPQWKVKNGRSGKGRITVQF